MKISNALSNSEVHQDQWFRHFSTLPNDDREIIERETRAAQAAGGSRLAVAKHLATVRSILCRNLSNPKQKRRWSLYLQVRLPGLASSRSQAFRDIQAWQKAEERFPASFLDEFLASGYALVVRPTIDDPLGKYTEPCERVLAKLDVTELNEKACQTVLQEATEIIKAKARMSRSGKTILTADLKRERILASIHNSIVRQIEDLSKATESGENYSSENVRDDLELIVGRLMTATRNDVLEPEPKSLPDGFERPKISGYEAFEAEGGGR